MEELNKKISEFVGEEVKVSSTLLGKINDAIAISESLTNKLVALREAIKTAEINAIGDIFCDLNDGDFLLDDHIGDLEKFAEYESVVKPHTSYELLTTIEQMSGE